MRWDEIERRFPIDLPEDEPLLSVSVVCHILGIQYYLLHEMIKEGLVKQAKKKKLFSLQDVKRIKYAKYLIEEKGVNVRGVKVIFEMEG